MKLIVASLVTALVVFVWGFISWTQLGWHSPGTIHNLPNEAVLMTSLDNSVGESGAYIFPGMPALEDAAEQETALAAMTAAYAKGPHGFLIITKGGVDMEDPIMFAKGFALDFVYALLAAWLLCKTRAANLAYGQRVMFVAGLGLFAGISTNLNAWHWMYFPTDYTLVMVADSVIAWFLGGMVLAAMLKPGAAANP